MAKKHSMSTHEQEKTSSEKFLERLKGLLSLKASTSFQQGESMHESQELKRADPLPNLFTPPAFKDLAKQRLASLQYKILIGLLVCASLAAIFMIFAWREVESVYGLALMAFEFILLILGLLGLRRGNLEQVSWILVGLLYGIFIAAFVLSSFQFTNALVLALVISLAGLLLNPLRVVALTIFMALTLLTLSYIAPSRLPPSEIWYILLTLGLEGLLLTVASRTLEKSFADANQSTQSLIHANKDLQDRTINLADRTEILARQTTKLQIAAEVSRAISSISDMDKLIPKAVDLVRDHFDFYHVGLFLLDEQRRFAVLTAGTGEAGRQMLANDYKLEINDRSMIGWSINHKEARITPNGSNQDVNSLLPNTHSELVLPLISQDEVIGALSIQSEQESAFSPEDIAILQTLADQLANGIEKAWLYEQIQQRAIELEKAKEVANYAKDDIEKARVAAEEANRNLAAQMWQAAGQASLNEKMRGDQDVATLANNIIQHLCKYLKVENGAIYTLEDKVLKLAGAYAYRQKSLEQQYQIGEDQIGQAVLEKGMITQQIPDEYIAASLRLGKLLPRFRLVAPVAYNQQVSGVVALESMSEFTPIQKHYLEQVIESVAIAFTTAQARTRVDTLFSQTRQQAEELQAQEEELRASNEELEAQTENLRAAATSYRKE